MVASLEMCLPVSRKASRSGFASSERMQSISSTGSNWSTSIDLLLGERCVLCKELTDLPSLS